MPSHTVENYLKSLFTLSNELGETNISELSNMMQISMPTANNMVKKLHIQGYVVYEKYRPLVLTEKGRKKAALVIRKHRLTEMYLVKKMGFGWEQVHDVADQIEHIRSPLLFDRMDELLDYPSVDPHGSPIPDKEGNILWKSYTKLSECKPGDEVKLSALTNSSSDFLTYLTGKQLRLGLMVEIKSKEAFDGSMEVSYNNHPCEMLSRMVCERLLVES